MRPFAAASALALAATCTAALSGCTGSNTGPERVVVPPGASFRQVSDSLAARGVIGNELVFRVLARVKGVDRSVRAGIYEFPAGASADEVLATLAAGRAVELRLTVPEGKTIFEIGQLAAERIPQFSADSFVAAARDSALADSLGLPGPTLEGYLRPDTYQLPADITPRRLVLLMANGFKEAWQPEWSARLDSVGLTQRELVTFASIIEGEARVDAERETIAGVYANRLRIGMALQADPTVQYAIALRDGKRKGRLYEKDYKTPSAYNTYLNPGLPPGPVNNPSRRSIEAALAPAKVPFLYFVAGPDGRHVFTRTYDEHLRAVARARRAARESAARRNSGAQSAAR